METKSTNSKVNSRKTSALKTKRPFWENKWLVCALLCVAIFALFRPVVKHDMVNYDDFGYLRDNVEVLKGLSRDGFVWAFTTGHMSNWHPLTWLSHMLDVQLFGPEPGWHHFTNVLFHALNTLLVFLVLKRMTAAFWHSAFVASLFALHPLHVESVAWISERKDVLSTFFWMLTIWAYARFAEVQSLRFKVQSSLAGASEITQRSMFDVRRSMFFYLLALLFFALGLMSKPMVVTLPFVLLLLDIWPLKRIEFVRPLNLNPNLFLNRVFLEKLPFFALTIAASVVTFLAQKKGGAVSTLEGLSIAARIENALVSYVRYLGKTFWPTDLSILYPHPGKWPMWQFICSALLLIAISALAVWLIRKRSYIFVGWFWFIGTLVPVIGIVQVGMQSMADRYTYVPLIGFFIAVTWLAADIVARWNFPKIAQGICAGIILLCCAVLTNTQIGYWKNSETLFGHAIKVTEKNYIAYNNLGYFYSHEERYDDAIAAYKKSLEIQPAFEDAHNNLGFALAKVGRQTEAIAHYRMALKIKPGLVEAHNNLGNSLADIGQPDEAIQHYEIAISKNPKHADAHNNYGIALAMKGKFDEAIGHFEKSLEAKPNNASAHSNLGNTYAVQGKFDEAMKHYFACLKIKPDDSQAHNNLANVLSQKGRIEEAKKHYLTSLEQNAKNPEANFNLGLLLLQQGNRADALFRFQEALRLKPDYTQARQQIAALTSQQNEPGQKN